jgi:hypothetical protein
VQDTKREITSSRCILTGRANKALSGRSQEGNREVEESLEGAGPTCGSEMQQSGARLPVYHGWREDVPSPAKEDVQSKASEWELREPSEKEEEPYLGIIFHHSCLVTDFFRICYIAKMC